MALSDEIQDAITRHQIFLLRYSSGRENEAGEYIDRITNMIENEMRDEEITGMDYRRLERFLDEVQDFSNQVLGDLEQKMLDDVEDLSNQETDWASSLLGQFFDNVESPSRIDTQLAVFAGVMSAVGGLQLRNATEQFRRNKLRQIVQTVRDGVTLRQENPQIINSIRGLNPLHKKQAGTLIRTMSNFASVQTRDLVFRENIGFFDGYEWVAVLDSRTSLICASRDGTVYPLTDDPVKSPKPPAHFSCRSTITPKVKAGFEDRVKKSARRIATGARGKTKVRHTTTYESWLRRQPASFQDDVLGVSRGALFRRGRLPLSNFIDLSGKTLTLEELRKVEPEVFNRVKL